MKTSTILIVLLFAFTTKTSFSALASTAVLDSNGDAIQPGVPYYIVSWTWTGGGGGGGGGSGLLQTFDPQNICPEIVIQSRNDEDLGLPVIFSSVDSTNEDILVNANITVRFVIVTRCPSSSVWQVVYDKSKGKNVVTLGGVRGETATYFTLTRAGISFYKFSHLGNDIGRYGDAGLIRLGTESGPAWWWSFVKAGSLKGHGKIKQVVNV